MPFVVSRFSLRLLAVAVVVLSGSYAGASAESTIDLTPRVAPNDLAEVTLELEVGGTMCLPQDTGANAQTKDLPMSVAAKLVYDEHRIAPSTGQQATRAVRWYKDAAATIKVDDDGVTPKLSDARRLVVVDNPGGRLVLNSPAGLMDREELDLVDAVCDPLALDALLPTAPVADGATWNADPAVMAGLLSLDTVAACEVQSVLDKFNTDFALVRLAGSVIGSVDGAATEMDLRGVYLFDRHLRRVTRCNLAVKEIRSVGGATPGLDSVAKLRLNVQSLEASEHLTAATLAPFGQPGKVRLDNLQLEAANQRFRVVHDRRWFVTRKDRETVTLRRVDGGDVVAHCTITGLPSRSVGRQTTLDEFEQDIRRSLGANFGELVSSRQWNTAYKHHCLEVVVRGTAQEVPVEWHYYLVAPESGPRVSVAVTIEGPMVARLANADRKLVNAIELSGAAPPVARSSTSPKAPVVNSTRPVASPPSAATTPPAAPATPPVRQRPAWSARAENLDRSLIVPGR